LKGQVWLFFSYWMFCPPFSLHFSFFLFKPTYFFVFFFRFFLCFSGVLLVACAGPHLGAPFPRCGLFLLFFFLLHTRPFFARSPLTWRASPSDSVLSSYAKNFFFFSPISTEFPSFQISFSLFHLEDSVLPPFSR